MFNLAILVKFVSNNRGYNEMLSIDFLLLQLRERPFFGEHGVS